MEKVNKIIMQIKENKWLHLAIIIVIGVILSIPLCKIQIRDTHDGFLHLLRLIGTNNALKIGEIPPIIAPYFCNGGGYAMNLFYNPLVTYIPLLIKLFTPSYAMALKIFAGLCIILSGITMYIFVYKVTKNRTIALFASIIYLISPYKLGDVYKRFAIGEFASFIFIPLLFIGIYSLFNDDKKKHYFITIGAVGLILTHTVTTFYTAIFCALYVILNLDKLKEKEVIKKLIINVIFILLISAFFLLPMIEAKRATDYALFDDQIICTNGKYAAANRLELSEFFVDKGEKNQTTYIIGVPVFVFMCLTIFTYKKVDIKYKNFYIACLLFAFIGLYMSSVYCPWQLFPNILCKLQYPWRMLTFFNFFISFVIGVNIYILLKMLFTKNITRLIVSLIIVILMVGYTIPLLLQYESNDMTKDEKRESETIQNPYINHMSINRDYLPIKALVLQRTYLQEKEDRIYILQGNANIINETKENLTVTAQVQNIENCTIIEFPFFYYPGYKVYISNNGNKQIYDAIETKNGFTGIEISEDIEEANIEIKYVGTTVTYISYIVSIIGLISFIIYIIVEQKRNKCISI